MTKRKPQEGLTPEEMEYHRFLVEQVKTAQGAWQLWIAHLGRRYKLGAMDTIGDTGEVIRGESPDA